MMMPVRAAAGLALAQVLALVPAGSATASAECPVGSLCYEAPALWVSDASVSEGTGGPSVLSFIVTRTGDTSDAINFGVTTSPGPAEAAGLGDYIPFLPGDRKVMPAGATEFVVEVPVSGDSTLEPDEQIQLTVDNAYAAGAISMMDALNGYAVGTNPAGLLLHDLTGDGLPELVSGDSDDGTVSVLLNLGGLGLTSFDSRLVYPVGEEPWAVAAGDLDGDGNADLVAVDRAGSTVEVLLQDVAGDSLAFASARSFTVGLSPSGLALGDMDGDGRLDIVTANALGGTLSVLRNTSTPGDLSFATVMNVFAGLGPRSVALGDLDGDGRLDAAVATVGGLVQVLRNTGSLNAPGFSAPLPLTAVSTLLSVVIADFDGDGRADVAVPNSGFLGQTVSLFLNEGTLGVPAFGSPLSLPVGQDPFVIDAGDVNGDGRPDLVTADGADGTVTVLRNLALDGAAGFADGVAYLAGSAPQGLALGDVNGDGQLDIAAACAGGENVVALVRNNLPPVLVWAPTALGTILNDDSAVPEPSSGGGGGGSAPALLALFALIAGLRRRSTRTI